MTDQFSTPVQPVVRICRRFEPAGVCVAQGIFSYCEASSVWFLESHKLQWGTKWAGYADTRLQSSRRAARGEATTQVWEQGSAQGGEMSRMSSAARSCLHARVCATRSCLCAWPPSASLTNGNGGARLQSGNELDECVRLSG